MSVRGATRDDIPAIQAVDRALQEGPSQTKHIERAIDEGRIVLAEAEANGELVGYVYWGWFWDKYPICILARVRPSDQRKGLGREMYDHVERQLRSEGVTFWLSSTEETNADSLRFHQALGFRQIGSLDELEQPVGEIFLRKDLG